jgi:hypothetical protein
MRVRDERAWREQLAEFGADEDSRLFRDFLVDWVGAADEAMAGVAPPPVRAALEGAFDLVEGVRGWLSVEWLAQMLLVVVQHWAEGDALWGSLSVWERRMVEQAAAVKLAELQQVAAAPAD